MLWSALSPDEARKLSAASIIEAINTLRYLRSEFGDYGIVDQTNMAHVDKALTRIDLDLSARAIAALPLAAE